MVSHLPCVVDSTLGEMSETHSSEVHYSFAMHYSFVMHLHGHLHFFHVQSLVNFVCMQLIWTNLTYNRVLESLLLFIIFFISNCNATTIYHLNIFHNSCQMFVDFIN